MVQGGAVGIPGLVSGNFDILYANCISTLTALERGIDLRVVAEATTINNHPPDVDALFIRKGDGFKTGKDLEGKIIAINVKYDLGVAGDAGLRAEVANRRRRQQDHLSRSAGAVDARRAEEQDKP